MKRERDKKPAASSCTPGAPMRRRERLASFSILAVAVTVWASGVVDRDIGRMMVVVTATVIGVRARSQARGTGIPVPRGRLVAADSKLRIWIGVWIFMGGY